MTILRFLFGHGWWTLWHAAFHLVLLVFVVMILLMFAQDLKPRGAKPDTPSPASIMVLMIALGLSFLTLVDGYLFVYAMQAPMWVKIVAPLLAAIVVGGSLFPLNIALATRQNAPAFWLNVLASVAIVTINLIMLWLVETRGGAPIERSRAWMIGGAIMCITIVSFATGASIGDVTGVVSHPSAIRPRPTQSTPQSPP